MCLPVKNRRWEPKHVRVGFELTKACANDYQKAEIDFESCPLYLASADCMFEETLIDPPGFFRLACQRQGSWNLSEPIEDEGKRVFREATKRGILLRLFGGIAVKYLSPSASKASLSRTYQDLDFFGIAKQGRLIKQLFGDLGYLANQRFNALHGDRRLIFNDPNDRWSVDVFLDVFKMCHALPIGKRLMLGDYTISVSDLLLTKLQIVEVNEKDVRDMLAILLDHAVADSATTGVGEVDSRYIAGLCSDDWGLCKTVMMNLKKIDSLVGDHELDEESTRKVRERVGGLLREIQTTPRSIRWKLRGLVGERMKWYELPEVPVRT